jgi:hypothetical protein
MASRFLVQEIRILGGLGSRELVDVMGWED